MTVQTARALFAVGELECGVYAVARSAPPFADDGGAERPVRHSRGRVACVRVAPAALADVRRAVLVAGELARSRES